MNRSRRTRARYRSRRSVKRSEDRLREPGFWRVLAVLGLALTIIIDLIGSLGAAHQPGMVLLAALLPALACGAVLCFVMRREMEVLVEDLDLLVPIGVALLATRLLWVSSSIPPIATVLNLGFEVPLISSLLPVSVESLLTLVVWVGYAAWQTDLLWRRLGAAPESPLAPHDSLPLFARAVGLLAIGWGGIVAILLLAMVTTQLSLAFTLAMMLIWTLVWNLLTVALLPCGLDRTCVFSAALSRGFDLSLRLARHWWRPVVLQMILLGMIVGMRVSSDTMTRHTTHSSINVNCIWAGAYAHNEKWYETYLQLKEIEGLPILATVLEILFLLLAVAIKVKVIRAIHSAGGNPAVPSGDPAGLARTPDDR